MLGQLNQTLGNISGKLQQTIRHGTSIVNHGKDIYKQASTIYEGGRQVAEGLKRGHDQIRNHYDTMTRGMESMQGTGGALPAAAKKKRRKY